MRLAKRFYGWPEDAQFLVPDGVYDRFRDGIGRRGRQLRDDWTKMFATYKSEHPQSGREIETLLAGDLPPEWDAGLPAFPADEKGIATRDASGKVLNPDRQDHSLAHRRRGRPFALDENGIRRRGLARSGYPGGRIMHFGVREHAMGAIVNGLVAVQAPRLRIDVSDLQRLHEAVDPACRIDGIAGLPRLHPRLRSALVKTGRRISRSNSFSGLRAIPNLIVLRPADANEVTEAYKVILALEKGAGLPGAQPAEAPDIRPRPLRAGIRPCARRLCDGRRGHGAPQVILIGTGSEVQLCIDVYEKLKAERIPARVVSMPSWELFERQNETYRHDVLPPDITARVTVEAGAVIGWDRYAGPSGITIGMHTFGGSAPAQL